MPGMIPSIIHVVALVLASGFLSSSHLDAAAPRKPAAIQGVMDLRGHDFRKGVPVELSGEWEYYRGVFIRTEKEYRQALRGGYTVVPGLWDPWTRADGAPGGTWHGSLVLTVRLRDNPPPLSIALGEVKSSYELYVNEARVGGAGRAGATAGETEPAWKPAVYTLPASGGEMRLVLNIANFHYVRGGLLRAPLLGASSAVMRAGDAARFAGMFLFGSIFIISLYQLALFLSRREDRAPLYFASFCLLVCAYLVTTGELIILSMVPGLPWEILVAVIYLSLYLSPVLFLRYLEELFPGEMPRRFRVITSAIFLLLAAAVAALPPRIYSFTLFIFHGVIAIVSIASFLAVVKAVRDRREGAIPLLAGIFLFMLAIINDILYYQGLVDTGDAAPAGVFLLILTHGFAVSRRHGRTGGARGGTAGESVITAERRKQLEWAVDFIRSHYAESISREGLAARLDLHPDTFGRLFRQHTGKKISEMINALRIEEAKRHLAGSSRTVIEIAMKVGFENLRTFNRVFREIEGTSPLEYRKKNPDIF